MTTAGSILETTDLPSDPVRLLWGKLFIHLKCLRTTEPKGPGLEIATLGDYSYGVIMSCHQIGKSAYVVPGAVLAPSYFGVVIDVFDQQNYHKVWRRPSRGFRPYFWGSVLEDKRFLINWMAVFKYKRQFSGRRPHNADRQSQLGSSAMEVDLRVMGDHDKQWDAVLLKLSFNFSY